LEERVRALEAAIRDMQNAIGNLRVIKDTGKGLPAMPPGSGHALAIARQKARWSNRDLSEAIGVTKSMLSLWECEKHAIPRWRAENIKTIFTTAGAEPPAWTDDTEES
jgi:DNA-binding transcriptional regulator YiaG